MSRWLVWILLLLVLVLSPFFGSAPIHVNELFNYDSLSSKIFFELRLPRELFAFFAGVILSLSGLLFQTLFRNPLMTPYTLGISSGAVLGAGIAIKLGIATIAFGIAAISLFGFIGAMATVILLIWLSKYLQTSQNQSILLLGIALSLFFTSALMVIFYLGSSVQNDMLIRFTMGSLSSIGWQNPVIFAVIATILLIAVYLYRFELQLLSISDDNARSKGVNTKKVTVTLLLISSFAIGVMVSISGPIGFVGLVVPHTVAKLYPSTVNRRIFKTALFGGVFLVLCDMLTRVINTQSELPIGVITAFIGGPFFIYLIISRSKK